MPEWLILMCLNMTIGSYVINAVCGCEYFIVGWVTPQFSFTKFKTKFQGRAVIYG